jgi:hypothetical protein
MSPRTAPSVAHRPAAGDQEANRTYGQAEVHAPMLCVVQLAGLPCTPAQIGVAPEHPPSLTHAEAVEGATTQTIAKPTAQCSTQSPEPHDPQLAPRVEHGGRVVLVLEVNVKLVVAVKLVVVTQATSASQLPHAVQQR